MAKRKVLSKETTEEAVILPPETLEDAKYKLQKSDETLRAAAITLFQKYTQDGRRNYPEVLGAAETVTSAALRLKESHDNYRAAVAAEAEAVTAEEKEVANG